jgi:hypothetical protein
VHAYIKYRRRISLQVESLEGKTLLSTGLVTHPVARHRTTAAIVSHAAAEFNGTLTGIYSNVHIPFAGYLLNYATFGTLSGVGSTNLHGSIFVRPGARARLSSGRLILRNSGGSMTINVVQSATPGTYTYRVVRAVGSDSAYRGGRGTLTITQNPTQSFPYYVSGDASMTFT